MLALLLLNIAVNCVCRVLMLEVGAGRVLASVMSSATWCSDLIPPLWLTVKDVVCVALWILTLLASLLQNLSKFNKSEFITVCVHLMC